MKSEDWIKDNRATFDSEYEALFAKKVLPLVDGLKWETVTAQYPFVDSDGRNRYCDFTIIESQSVRVAIEIDGYDKRGTGSGMTHSEFLDWQRRQASLASRGWHVLRFANRDVRDEPRMCAKHITNLLRRLRQAQTGRIEIVTFQSTESELIAAPTPLQMPQTPEVAPKQKNKFGLIVGLICLAATALWQINDFELHQDLDVRKKSTTSRIYGTLDCKNPQDWTAAKNNVGHVVTVRGPLLDTRPRPDITGSPLWIDIGKQFPEKNRLTIVVWGQNWPKFDMSELDLDTWRETNTKSFRGVSFCITGRVSEYKGAPQIELSTPDQIRIVFSDGV
jgi:hypothetical protein